ncbi:MAG: transglycosylase SLT domain-containing protein, partial [Flavobacteriales bacterium]
PMGYEYELLKRLADHLGLKLELKIAKNMNDVFKMLNSGEGDLVAYGLTITKDRKKKVAFTKNHNIVEQVLVQKLPENKRQLTKDQIDDKLIRNPLELLGKKVHVRKNSSYFERLNNLEEELGGEIDIQTIPGNITTGQLIKRVAKGEIKYTIADKNIALVNKTYYPEIDIETPVSFPQRIAWAVRKNSPKLLKAINDWISDIKKTTDYYVIYNKYFKNRRRQQRRVKSKYFTDLSGKISKYDKIFKKYAAKLNMDWRLLASQSYQESKFNPNVKSWAGAKGLMQLMPATAKQYNVKNINNPEQSVKAGVRYLKDIWKQWNMIDDTTTRWKFTFASYNVGPGHVKDARRLTEKYGKDKNSWKDVSKFLKNTVIAEALSHSTTFAKYIKGMNITGILLMRRLKSIYTLLMTTHSFNLSSNTFLNFSNFGSITCLQ